MEDSGAKLRRCKSARPDLARRSRTETHWDPWDAVVQARVHPLAGMHWSQMRAQAAAGCTARRAAAVSDTALPGNGGGADLNRQELTAKAEGVSNRPKTATFAAAPRPQLSPHPNSASWLAKLNTGYNQRARQGFVYWFTARPKPTLFGRYSTGAKHMQYGLCMAPRS